MRPIVAGLALLASLVAACERQAPPLSFRLADGQLPNVLLITVDTLRADHLGTYAASAAGMTPSIDRLAGEAVVFDHAGATVPATRPSLASLHTGRYPGAQPVRTNRMDLPAGIPVLAELLQAAGYQTAAYYGNSLLGAKSGFGRGFEGYTSFVPLAGPADPGGADLARGWIQSMAAPPWFLWVHFMDPHGPYDSAPLSWSTGIDAEALPDRVLPFSATDYGLGVIPKYQRLGDLDHAREYRRRYRGEVHFTDAQVGRLLAVLDEANLRARTLVVLSADHGESLGEHDLFFQHGWFPSEESARVPLIMRPPGEKDVAPRRVTAPVSLVDVLPTLLAGLGLAVPPGVEGRDLSPALGGVILPSAPVFTVTGYLNQMTAMRLDRWKLVHTPLPPRAVDGDPWAAFYAKRESFVLYDLTSDPGETRDVAGAEASRLETMRPELLRWEKAHSIPIERESQTQLDPETRERLKALGYGS